MRLIDADELIKRINTAEKNFEADHMETIGGDIEDPFVDGILSGVFCIREMVTQAPTIERLSTVKAIPLDEVKKAREEIENLTPWDEGTVEMYCVLEIIDKLIESEDKI